MVVARGRARIGADVAAHTRAPAPQYERILRAADGTTIEAIVQLAPVCDAEGQPAGMVATFKDIRDRVRRERDEQRRRVRAEALARISGALAQAGNTRGCGAGRGDRRPHRHRG